MTIEDYAFQGAGSLTNIFIPMAHTIGRRAFQNCSQLSQANLSSVQNLSEAAFQHCSSLRTVELPMATNLPRLAFAGCRNLQRVEAPLAFSVGDSAFEGDESLRSFDMPNVIMVGRSAFAGCFSLSSVHLPRVRMLLPHAFANCPILKEVKITAAGTIGEGTFVNCSWLHTISMPKVSVIGHSAFRGAEKLEAVDAPKARQLENYSFADCGSNTRLTLPKVATIGAEAFKNNVKLESAVLPSADTLGLRAFEGCSELKEVSIPIASRVEVDTFYKCDKLVWLEVSAPLWRNLLKHVTPFVGKPCQNMTVPAKTSLADVQIKSPSGRQMPEVIGDFDIMIVNCGEAYPDWPPRIALPEPVVDSSQQVPPAEQLTDGTDPGAGGAEAPNATVSNASMPNDPGPNATTFDRAQTPGESSGANAKSAIDIAEHSPDGDVQTTIEPSDRAPGDVREPEKQPDPEEYRPMLNLHLDPICLASDPRDCAVPPSKGQPLARTGSSQEKLTAHWVLAPGREDIKEIRESDDDDGEESEEDALSGTMGYPMHGHPAAARSKTPGFSRAPAATSSSAERAKDTGNRSDASANATASWRQVSETTQLDTLSSGEGAASLQNQTDRSTPEAEPDYAP